MKDKGVNLDKIDRMLVLAFENAIRIHTDSIILYKKKRYPSAFFLSILSMEEIGKMFILGDFLFHSAELKDNKELMEEFSQEGFLDIYFHPPKQKQFFNNPISERHHYRKNRYSALYKLIFSNEIEERNRPDRNSIEAYDEKNIRKLESQFRRTNELERLKQSSMYVGLPKKGRKINLKGKIETPYRIKRRRAQEHITTINDFFLLYILGLVKEVYCSDSCYLESFVNRKMFHKLFKLWHYRKASTRRELKRIQMSE